MKAWKKLMTWVIIWPEFDVKYYDEADPQSFMCDKFAIASVNSGLDTVGHIPKFMSKLTYFLLKCGRHIKCEIAGVKKSSKDLEQG